MTFLNSSSSCADIWNFNTNTSTSSLYGNVSSLFDLETSINMTLADCQSLLLEATTQIATTTTTTTTTLAPRPKSTLPLALMREIQWWIVFCVNPIISSIGLVGNILGIILISRDGLKRSSNVLLISLAIADICTLLAAIYDAVHLLAKPGYFFTHSRPVNTMFYCMYVFFHLILRNMAMICSFLFCAFITTERLIAIYFPLKFHVIVTPTRTLAVVIITALCSSPFGIVKAFTVRLTDPFVFRGEVSQAAVPSDFHRANREGVDIMDDVTNEITGNVAISYLVVSSLIISYKVGIAAKRRAAMMSQDAAAGKGKGSGKRNASQSKTTRTLLLVCVTFVILSGICYVYDWVRSANNFKMELVLFGQAWKNVIFCINSSSNFFIYVFSNDKFRIQLIAMFSNSKDGKLPGGKSKPKDNDPFTSVVKD